MMIKNGYKLNWNRSQAMMLIKSIKLFYVLLLTELIGLFTTKKQVQKNLIYY